MIDIKFYYSGGSSNSLARNSIGGLPSDVVIATGPNNIFEELEGISDAFTDFRCCYAFNDSAESSVKNVMLYLHGETGEEEVVINMGVRKATDEQIFTFNAAPTGGTLTIDYSGIELVVDGDADLTVFSENIRTALDSVAPGVVVNSVLAGTGVVTTVRFEGSSDNRVHPDLELVNALTGVTTAIVTRVREGGPINQVPDTIPNDRTTPNGVSFIIPSIDAPIEIGTLGPGDGFAFWIRRGVPSESTLSNSRLFKVRCRATLSI